MPAHKSKPKLTCKRKAYLLKDEKEASKEYRSYGWKKQGKQEAAHRKFIKKQPCRK